MAIANTNEVKFLYAANVANASKEVGVISFAEDTRQILVGTGAEAAVAFAGNVKNATFTDGILTIERNSGDNLTLNFKNIASATATMAAFKSLDDAIKAETAARGQAVTTLTEDITNITKEGGTIDTKVAAEAKARKDEDDAIKAKIGTVADGSTLVGMIEDAKNTAIAAGTIVATDSSFVTVEKSGAEGGTQTYTIKTSDIAKASDLANTDASLAAEIQNRATAITDAVGALNSSVNDADEAGFVSVSVTETAGKLTAIEVTTNDIAKATDLTDVSTRVKTNEDAIATLNGDGAGSVKKQVSDAIAGVVNSAPEAFDTLGEIATWITNDQTGAAAMSAQIAAHTTAIADNSTAIANLDSSYKAADTQIRTDFATADASVLSDAKAYAKTAVDQAHTHDNKTVLDGISSAKVSAWDSAEQNAKNYADGLAGNYATAAQGALADSAVQNITTGGTNGTINVDGTEVAVKGLGSAAYEASTAFDRAGAAADASAAAYASAQAYADAITVNGQGQSGQAITITGADIKVGGGDTTIANKSLAAQIAAMKNDIQAAQDAGVQSFAVAAGSTNYAYVDNSTGDVSFSIKTVALDGLTDSSANGLVDAKTIKAYVDNTVASAALKWQVA